MANNRIQVKRTSVSGRLPNTTSSGNSSFIDAGELALNLTDGILYSSNGSSIIPIGANNVNINVSGNLTVTSVVANGSLGSNGQVLTSNGSSVYWANSTGSGSVDVNAQYVWTNTQTFTNTITFNATINGTANNSLYLNGTAANGYQTTAGLSANVATLTSNNATYAFGKSEVNLNVNNALTSNNSSYLNGNSAGDLRSYSDTQAANAYSNATSFATTAAAAAYSNATSYADSKAADAYSNAVSTAAGDASTKAATAYSNATSYTDSRIIDSVTNTSVAYAASANSVKNAYDRAIDANTRAASAQTAASAAYTNAIAYSGNAAQAYSNATSYADTKAATAYSNATSYADTKAATAYSNATSYTDSRIIDSVTNTSIAYAASANSVKNAYDRAIDANTRAASAQTAAASAYSNAIAYSGNAALAYSNAVVFASNASNINTGTLVEARLPYRMDQNVRTTDSVQFGNMVLTGNLVVNGGVLAGNSYLTTTYAPLASPTFTGTVTVANITANAISANATTTNNITVNANLTVRSIVANGSLGNTGQVLTTNGANVYWANSTAVGGGNANSIFLQYTGNGTNTIYTIPGGYTNNSIAVYLNGVLVRNGLEANVASGSDIVFTEAPPTGALIDVIGIAPVYNSNGFSAAVSQQFTGNGTANSFTITGGYIANTAQVFLNGVKQIPGVDVVTTSGTTVNFITPPANGYTIDVSAYQGAIVATNSAIVVGNTSIGLSGLTADQITVGNSTINTFANSTTVAVGGNTLIIGTAAYHVANGNFGIGTATPSAKLHVLGGNANDAGPEIRIAGSGGLFDIHNNLSVGNYNSIVAEGDKALIFTSGTQNTGSLVIAPWFAGTSGIRITNTGSVGINISSPDANLAVQGTANVSGNVTIGGGLTSANLTTTTNTVTIGTAAYYVANGNFGIGITTPGDKFVVSANANTNAGMTLYNTNTGTSTQAVLGIATSGATGLQLGQNYSSKNVFIYTGDAASMTFSTNATAAMTIASNGNIGVGNTAPAVRLVIGSTDAVRLPVGNTAQRPTAATGYIRFNSDLTSFEGYNGTAWTSVGGAATGPAFSATATTNQSVTSAAYTKVNLAVEEFDTANCYDTSLSRFTPNVAGYYMFNGCIYGIGTGLVTVISVLYKNGTGYQAGAFGTSLSGNGESQISQIVYMNGTTDYIELYGYLTGSSGLAFAYLASPASFRCRFSGSLLRAA